MDAHRRGMNGFLWGLLVFFTCVVGVVVYLLVVGGETPGHGAGRGTPGADSGRPCGSRCGAGLEAGFLVCPYGGHSLGPRCPECGERLAADWNVCPVCARRLERAQAEAPS